MSNSILVIGAGQAAASFAARLRAKDTNCKITLIGGEPHLPYQRPPLSKKYATGDMTTEQLLLRPADWYEQNAVSFHLSATVSAINTEAKSVSLADGQVLHWNRLMLTTGSRPRSLPQVIGGALPGVYLLRGMEDADRFAEELVKGRKVVIIGGGYIGLEAAAVCAAKGLEVILIEAADRILQRVACPETSNWFRTFHQGKGVTIHEGVGLEKITASSARADTVILSNGSQIEADFILVGIGIIPNTELAVNAGLTVQGGITVDEYCCTSHPDIYAAGDCASFMFRGEPTRLESVQNAIDQAECAADNIAGEARPYIPYPWFWSDQYDVKLQIAGLNRGYDRIVVRKGKREGAVSHFYFAGDTFLAVDAINDPRTYMVGKKMLEAGKNISPEQAGDTELELKSLLKA